MMYQCTDGYGGEVEIEATSAPDAAQQYVDSGDWEDVAKTWWIDVRVTPLVSATRETVVAACVAADIDASCITSTGDILLASVADDYDIDDLIAALPVGATAKWAGSSNTDADGNTTEDITITLAPAPDNDNSERITIEVNPDEPDCADDESHDWQSPHEVVRGLRENPGVYGHGCGVIITEVCCHCGSYKVKDTWAQRSDNGQQGLESIEYRDADAASEAWVASLKKEEPSAE